MKYNYFGKITMFILAVMLQIPILGIIFAVAIGHIIDIRMPSILIYLNNKYTHQKHSENIIFLLAYYCKFLSLDIYKAAKILKTDTISKNHNNDRDLLFYYYNEYIPKNLKKLKSFDKKMTKAMATIKNNLPNSAENCILFFRLVEKIFNDQIKNPSDFDLKNLKTLSNMLNIEYIRTKNPESEKTKYTYNEQEDINSNNYQSKDKINDNEEEKSSYVSQEVKDSLKLLGFNYNKLPTIEDVKKSYKSKVLKCHPDILKGQNASEDTIKKSEIELTKLNKSMDIVKKFLANQ